MDIPTQITDNIDLAAKAVVDTNERILDGVVSFHKSVVDGAVRGADKLPTVELPFADKLPTPTEAGDRYLDVVEQIVAANRDFTAQVVGMLPTGVAPVAKTKATKAAK
ncbi:hypothetical protein [Ilumatobacter nonamiensis]|uniref:hypothetical protein n=1 Tax=Ilumatobacter nonamiensis TaxID=467093 RepID=UPI0003475F15|nr:hypothetical protein [Ilumatobacter nonamiensis]